MEIIIRTDNKRSEEYQDEIFNMFKLICDNLGVDGLECEVFNNGCIWNPVTKKYYPVRRHTDAYNKAKGSLNRLRGLIR